jgi:hypothetical protein
MSTALEHLAARVGSDPLFLAHALAEYARTENLDDDGLAAALGCPRPDLARLKLCRAPRPDAFQADVRAVAVAFALSATVLANVVRQGQAFARLRGAAAAEGAPGFLLAARDADPPRPPTDGGERS